MEWISVKDRLPAASTLEDQVFVIAFFDWQRPPGPKKQQTIEFAEICGGHWRPMGGNGNFDKYVTHWMPLPPPPNR